MKLEAELAAQQACEAQNPGAEEHDAAGFRSCLGELVRHKRKAGGSVRPGVDLNVLFHIDKAHSRETEFVKQLGSATIVVDAQLLELPAGARWQHSPQTNGFVNEYGASSGEADTANAKTDIGDERTTRVDSDVVSNEGIHCQYAGSV